MEDGKETGRSYDDRQSQTQPLLSGHTQGPPSGSRERPFSPPHTRFSTDSIRSVLSDVSSVSSSGRRRLRPPSLSKASGGDQDRSPLIRSGIVKSEGLMWLVTCFASLGVFVFGYDQGVMSGIITGPYFRAYFDDPTPSEIGTMVAVLEIGAFVTSLACGTLADVFGRKRIIFFGALIFGVGGTLQTLTTGFYTMVLGRIISGLGVGMLTMVVPMYQSEISPAENRGKLACIEFTGNIIGYSISVWTDYLFSFLESDLSWRIPLSIQCLAGLLLCVGSLLLPESPRWLVDHDQDADALRILGDLHGNGNPKDKKAVREWRQIKENVLEIREEEQERGRGYKEMWGRYKYRIFIACSGQMCAQLNGINVISYYAPNVFLAAGWLGRDAILMAGINSVSYVLSTIPTWYLVDRVGRRPILLFGAVACALALFAMGGFIYLHEEAGRAVAGVVVACVVIYDASHGATWGAIPWLLPNEVMPLSFRAKGASAATATNWFFNWGVGSITPILQASIGWGLYPIHGFLCLGSFALVYFCYPETAGRTLEEMDVVFGDKPEKDDWDDDDSEDDPEQDEEGEAAMRDATDDNTRRNREAASLALNGRSNPP